MNPSNYVAVIGGTNIDVVAKPAQELTTGESAPGTCTIESGGVALNISRHLRSLGHNVSLVTAIGEGPLTPLLQETLRLHKINDFSKYSPNHSTSVYCAIQNQRGETQFGVSSMEVIRCIDPEYIRSCEALLNGAQVVCADANLLPETLATTAQVATVPLVIDAVSPQKSTRVCPILSDINVLKCNINEAHTLLSSNLSASECAEALHHRGVEWSIVTATKGVWWCAAGDSGQLPVDTLPITSDKGLGDAMTASIIHAYINQSTCGDAVAQACAYLKEVI